MDRFQDTSLIIHKLHKFTSLEDLIDTAVARVEMESPEEWLKRKMEKLREKRSNHRPPTYLEELKSSFNGIQRKESFYDGVKPQKYPNRKVEDLPVTDNSYIIYKSTPELQLPPHSSSRQDGQLQKAFDDDDDDLCREVYGNLDHTHHQRNSTHQQYNVQTSQSKLQFTQDTHDFWYKPNISREEAVLTLLKCPPSSFIIRNSNSFPGAYGLAIRVEEGVRHFLVEPTKFGVRLRGCGDVEPVFGSLPSLVYAHTTTPLALPCTLTLPTHDLTQSNPHPLHITASTHLLYLGNTKVERFSGEEAVYKATPNEAPIPVTLRLSRNGLTLTDLFRERFFRIHYPLHSILYSTLTKNTITYKEKNRQLFAIVVRTKTENEVILLAELDEPASAVVGFLGRVCLNFE